MKTDIAIIGGGASGIFAAIIAARSGGKVTIFEKNPRVGKKILSTGNGRCNFTNINAGTHNYNSDFASFALNKFPPKKAIAFFEELGLLSKVESEGRVYPMSGQASAVLDVLRLELDRLGVNILTETCVSQIQKNGDGFIVVTDSGEKHFAKKVIAASGGMAAPKSGSDGSGYAILKMLGHTVTPLVPSLVQIKTSKGIQGVRAYGRVTLEDGKTDIGEIQFNNYGLSGIPVFSLAKHAKKGRSIFVDLLPDYSEQDVLAFLKKRPTQTMETYLVGVLNKSLGQMLLKECGILPLSRMSDTLTENEIKKIASKIKHWRFEITGVMPWENAQVTSGGVSLDEVSCETMESKIVKGLYIIGELLDIDGDCGGFNLQWAWSSGFAAGSEAVNV
ncbi:MAG: NAD(P)/FAD-dependent oxidoreductase [Clostridia bacterium]|nr:NAD(P)/FAD-dependent oxidoreductase [Clostridia bacterium]